MASKTDKSRSTLFFDKRRKNVYDCVLTLFLYLTGVKPCLFLNKEMKYAVEEKPESDEISVMLLSVVSRSFSASFNFIIFTYSEKDIFNSKVNNFDK